MLHNFLFDLSLLKAAIGTSFFMLIFLMLSGIFTIDNTKLFLVNMLLVIFTFVFAIFVCCRISSLRDSYMQNSCKYIGVTSQRVDVVYDCRGSQSFKEYVKNLKDQ